MIIILRSLLFNLLFYLWTVFFMIIGIPCLLLPRLIALKVVKSWVHGVVGLLRYVVGIRYEVRGREHLTGPPAIVASKHQSAWETITLQLFLGDPAIVLKKELGNIPLYGQFIRKFGLIPVDRKGGRKSVQDMLEKAEQMKGARRYIAIFPEGTRTPPGQRGHYHKGIALLYGRLSVPVVPVALNSGVLWGRRQFLKRPGTIIMEFLPAIPAGLTRDDFIETLEDVIETASLRLYKEATAT
jgi:1-acyl-sn-glycerol-3-phosphate acyltransferase